MQIRHSKHLEQLRPRPIACGPKFMCHLALGPISVQLGISSQAYNLNYE